MQNDRPNFNSAQFLSVFQPSGTNSSGAEAPLNVPPPFPIPGRTASAAERNSERLSVGLAHPHSNQEKKREKGVQKEGSVHFNISDQMTRSSLGGASSSSSTPHNPANSNINNARRTNPSTFSQLAAAASAAKKKSETNASYRSTAISSNELVARVGGVINRADSFETPQLPFASPNCGVTNPVSMPNHGGSPNLITPMTGIAHPMMGMNFSAMHPSPNANPKNSAQFCSCNRRAGESCSFCWSWDCRSETSAPSLWSAASTRMSFRSKASGQYVVGQELDACIDGQRLLYVRPQQLTTSGGKVYIELIRTIPQPLYSEIEVLLVAGKQGMINLKPEAIRKGKKLCVQIPNGLDEGQDYDVRVKFAGKMLHGSFPLEIRDLERGGESD